MKRILSLILALLLIASLWGCTRQEDPDKPLTFYYSRAEYVYGNEGSVMGAEEREWNGQSDDLKGILTLYLNGPLRRSGCNRCHCPAADYFSEQQIVPLVRYRRDSGLRLSEQNLLPTN